jgi:hypothetical protein
VSRHNRASEKGFEMVWSERLLIRPFIATSTNSDQPAHVLYRQGCGKQFRVKICPAQIEAALQIIAPHALSYTFIDVLPRYVVEYTVIVLLSFPSVVILLQ